MMALAAALLVAAFGCGATPPASTLPGESLERLAGEHGLWVEERNGRVHVAWITADGGPGSLEVVDAAGNVVHRASSRRGPSHRVSFPSGGRERLTLRYGGTGIADRHETSVRLGSPARAPFELPAPDTLFVIGDTHGLYDRTVAVLQSGGVIDHGRAWSAGRAHFVVLGDIFDRGADVHALLWMFHRLEGEAQAAGGALHLVLGNHELLAMTDRQDYVAEKELRVAALHGTAYPELFDTRRSVLGRWLATRPGVIRVGEMVLAHGGLAHPYAEWSLEALNDSLHLFMTEPMFHYLSGDRGVEVPLMEPATAQRRLDLFYGPDSPLWHREYVQSDTAGSQLAGMLARHGARWHAVAHTPVPRILTRYDGALIAVQPHLTASELLRVVSGATGPAFEVVDASGTWRPLGPD
jgi:hypothetical protein